MRSASSSLARHGLLPAADPGAIFAAKIEALKREHGLMPVHVLIMALLSGFLKPEDIPHLKYVQLAPNVTVAADALRWNEDLNCLLLVTDDGNNAPRVQRVDRLFDHLNRANDDRPGTAWHPVDLPDGTRRLQRVALELDTILAIQKDLARAADADAALGSLTHASIRRLGFPPRLHQVVDIHDRWQLVERSSATQPFFADQNAAIEAAEQALSGDGGDHVFLDRFNWTDPCSS